MRATEVIETYIDDTVRLLPRRLRSDVANELRSLLNEELQGRAVETGHEPDESMALALVRGHGAPNEVAARYQPPWSIIDPADSTCFLRAAIIGTVALILLSALIKDERSKGDLLHVAIFAWLGLLGSCFAAKNWIRTRFPKRAIWQPRDRDRISRIGTAFMVPIASACVVLYAVPTWVLDQISRGRFETAWATYTEDFQRRGLPCFIGLLAALLLLRSYIVIPGRWNRLTRRIDIGLNVILAGLTLVLAEKGNIFVSSKADAIAQDVFSMVAAIYVPFVGVLIYGEMGRVATRRPNEGNQSIATASHTLA